MPILLYLPGNQRKWKENLAIFYGKIDRLEDDVVTYTYLGKNPCSAHMAAILLCRCQQNSTTIDITRGFRGDERETSNHGCKEK